MNCHQTFDGEELYPGIIEKAARLTFGICVNHPFVDGNKRAAVTAMLVILRLNNVAVSFTQSELVALGLGLADGSFVYDDVLAWIRAHVPQKA